MDMLLGKFVQKHIDKFNDNELKELENLLLIEDEIIYNWYFKNENNNKLTDNKLSSLLKKFRL